MANTKAVIYARVSSNKQEQEGFSIPAQLELLRDYANKHGLLVAEEFVESETAAKKGRPKFNAMLKACQAKNGPKIILVEKTDRLYRNFKDALAVRDAVEGAGVAVHLVKEGNVLDANTPGQAKLVHNIYISIAENFIDNLSAETKKGLKQRASSGLWNHLAPYGYQNDKNAKTLALDPTQSPYVIAAFTYYATGLYSLEKLRRLLFDKGLFYTASTPKAPTSQLHRMLSNPVYIGMVSYQGELFEGKHQPLVARDVFYAVQRLLKATRKPFEYGAKGFTYKGLLRCGDCNHLMTGEEKKGGAFIYYWCSFKGCPNHRRYINEKALDAAVEQAFKGAKIPKAAEPLLREAFQLINTAATNTYDIEYARITTELKRQRAKIRKAAEARIEGEIDKPLWLEIKADADAAIASLEVALGQLNKAESITIETLSELFELPQLLATAWPLASQFEKIKLANLALSNFYAVGKEARPVLKEPLQLKQKCQLLEGWLPTLDVVRTIRPIVPAIGELVAAWRSVAA